MPPVGYVPHKDGYALAADVHGRHQGDVGQVGAPQVRVVEDNHIAGAEGAGVNADGRIHRRGHSPQVHWHMGGLGNHLALGVEEGAGVVPALLDIGRVGGALEGYPHLFTGGDEQVLENFQAYRIDHIVASPLGSSLPWGDLCTISSFPLSRE